MNEKIYRLSGVRLISSFLENNIKNDLLITYEDEIPLLNKLNIQNIFTFNMTNYDYLNNWLEENEDIIPIRYGGLYDKKTCKNKALNHLMKDTFNEKSSLWFRKIASLKYAVNHYKYDYIIWIDADCMLKQEIKSNILISQFYERHCFYHMGKKRHKMTGAIESSFIGFSNYRKFELLHKIINMYSKKQFMKFQRWDDGFVMARVILNSKIKSLDLMPETISHLEPLEHSFFKDYVIHYKGSHHYKKKNNLNIKDHTVYENKISKYDINLDYIDNEQMNDLKVLFITSSTKKMYDLNGRKFLKSFLKYYNNDILFTSEKFELDIKADNIIEYDISNYQFLIDWLKKFSYLIPKELGGTYNIKKNKHKFMTPKTDYNVHNNLFLGDWNYKASLWFRKIASLHYAYENFRDKYNCFIWIDIDSLILKNIAKKRIDSLFNNKDFFYYHNNYRESKDYGIEAGLMGWKQFDILKEIFHYYESGEFAKFNRWDDGYIIKQIIFSKKYNKLINNVYDSDINKYIVHLKGTHWRQKIDYERS